MNRIMKINVTKKKAGTILPHEYFDYEKKIFGIRYKSCPTTYNEYKKIFLYDYIVVEIRINKDLSGLLISDILLNKEIYYIRLIAIEKRYRDQKLTNILLKKFLSTIEKKAYVVFVSENNVIENIIMKNIYCSVPYCLSKSKRQIIKKYNKKLPCIKARKTIEGYYQVYPDGFADAILFILRIENEKH